MFGNFTYGLGEDAFLEGLYEDRFYVDDVEEWELNQLTLDREYDREYDEEYDEEPEDEAVYDPDLDAELV